MKKNNPFDNILQAIFAFNLHLQFDTTEEIHVSETSIYTVFERRNKKTGKLVDKFIKNEWRF